MCGDIPVAHCWRTDTPGAYFFQFCIYFFIPVSSKSKSKVWFRKWVWLKEKRWSHYGLSFVFVYCLYHASFWQQFLACKYVKAEAVQDLEDCVRQSLGPSCHTGEWGLSISVWKTSGCWATHCKEGRPQINNCSIGSLFVLLCPAQEDFGLPLS